MIEIDISGVPPERRTDPLFLLNLADVEAKLADPEEIQAICIHEAAHYFYMIKAGMSGPIFTGPKIVYNDATGKYDRYGAMVQCPNRNEDVLATLTVGMWAFLFTKAHAAGGVAAKVLAGRTDCGDSEDRTNFDTAYALLQNKYPDQTHSADEMWAEARRVLGLELEQKHRCELILSMAEQIKPELFKS